MAEGRGEPTGTAGMLVRRWRTGTGLTQQELAARAGVSVGAVRDLEQGRVTRPRARILEQLAGALGLGSGQRADLAAAAAGIAGRSRRPGKGLWLRVLGTMGCWHGSMPVSLGPARQRAVVALLAVHPNTAVRREAIIDALWSGGPPGSAVAVIQSHVSRLRKILDGGLHGRLGRAVLVSTGTSYRLDVGPDELDLLAFHQLAARARHAAAEGDLAVACQQFEQALELWKGEPLADLDVLAGHPAVVGLTQLRASVITEYAQIASGTGLVGRVLPHLRALAEREPLNERAYAQLMMCLAATGQQAHALQIYEDLRQRLDDQLGVRPGPELADTHLRVLRQEIPVQAAVPGTRTESPVWVADASDATAASKTVPQQLPAAVRYFVGRRRELAELSRLLEPDSATGGTVVISAIGGTAGVGKTALAVRWAHQVAQRFPDGQLYVNLRGYDPGQPMTAADALAGFLRALGVAGQDIPAVEAERAARYRSLLAGRRMLVVLDNAGSVEQVRPLLPGFSTCAVLVTSRDALAGLVARDGAERLDLDLLPMEEAVGLLRALIGTRVDADPSAAEVLAARCCRLPLALRIAAELAVARPTEPLAELAEELADQQERLDLLEAGGDRRTAVRAALSWSYRQLDSAAARAFRLLGLHPGTDFEPYAAAALTGTTVPQARQLIDVLTRAHLIQSVGPGRYGMHDLLRAYARNLAGAQDSGEHRRTALTRLFDAYLYTASMAMDTLYGDEPDRRPRVTRPAAPVPRLTDVGRARGWLDAERGTLVALMGHAAEHGWPGHATRLAATLFRYLDGGGHNPEALVIHDHARMAARHAGDRAAEATALNQLAAVHWRLGRYQEATWYLDEALALFREMRDRTGQARVLANLGIINALRGHHEQSLSLQGQALKIHRETGNRMDAARSLGNLGTVEERLGRYEQAAAHYQEALALCREIRDRRGESYGLANLGMVGVLQGRYQHALDQLQPALALFRELGDRNGEAETLTRIGDAYHRLGHQPEAVRHQTQALTLFREIGDRSGEAAALNGLGEALLAVGRPGDGCAQHATALGVASEIDDRFQQARAHAGLAHSHRAADDRDQARYHWQHALALYTELGVPQAAEVRAQLAAADRDDHPEQEASPKQEPPSF